MTKLAVVPINAALHARAARFYSGDRAEILTVMPEFSLLLSDRGRRRAG
jgi:hypothetical protein